MADAPGLVQQVQSPGHFFELSEGELFFRSAMCLSLSDICNLRIVEGRALVACSIDPLWEELCRQHYGAGRQAKGRTEDTWKAEFFTRMKTFAGEVTMSRSPESNVNRKYQALKVVGSGVFGVVYRAFNRATNSLVAVKVLHAEPDIQEEGVPTHVIREVSLMRDFRHPHVVTLHEVEITDQMEYILVMEYAEKDLHRVLRQHQQANICVSMDQVARWSWELLNGIQACHLRLIIHRDLKPQNILISRNSLKICDFGLARTFQMPVKPYTHNVVTLWYRAPEILLGARKYGPEVDMWSAGCIIAEMATCQALFRGNSEIDTIFKIMNLLGTPTENSWPGSRSLQFWTDDFPRFPVGNLDEIRALRPELGDEGINLLQNIIVMNPEARCTSRTAQGHTFFGVHSIPRNV